MLWWWWRRRGRRTVVHLELGKQGSERLAALGIAAGAEQLGGGLRCAEKPGSLDLAALTVKVLREYHDVSPLILCGDEDEEISIAEVGQMVADALDYKKPLVMDTTKSDGQYKKTASNKKLRALWPDFEFTPMEAAVKETADWFLANYDSCRK